MATPFDAVSTYFQAKDSNRPFLMRRAFAPDVELEMIVKTDAISFPSSAKGLTAVKDILARRFANDLENVYSFCLSRPTEANRHHFPCHWLVGMSEKGHGPIRVGSGRYDWYFTPDVRSLAALRYLAQDDAVSQAVPQPGHANTSDAAAWPEHLVAQFALA